MLIRWSTNRTPDDRGAHVVFRKAGHGEPVENIEQQNVLVRAGPPRAAPQNRR
jgi:hypothetical protein